MEERKEEAKKATPIHIRVTVSQRVAIEERAKAAGMTVSSYMRFKALQG